MEELPVPDWKAREDGIFNIVEEAGALKQCVDQMVADLAQDQELIAQLAAKLLERHDTRQILAESAQIEEYEPRSPCSMKSNEPVHTLAWPDDVIDRLEGLMEEEVQQMIAERVWLKLDPAIRHEPSAFLMRCVRAAAQAFYVGRAADPELQGIPPEMIQSGGMVEIKEEPEADCDKKDHQAALGPDLPPGFTNRAKVTPKIEEKILEGKHDPDNFHKSQGLAQTAIKTEK